MVVVKNCINAVTPKRRYNKHREKSKVFKKVCHKSLVRWYAIIRHPTPINVSVMPRNSIDSLTTKNKHAATKSIINPFITVFIIQVG